MKAIIITVGNEILSGRTVNTNFSFIARMLTFSGYEVIEGIIIRDDIDAISRAFREASSSADLVISSGGLGPTFDDITLEGFSRAFNLKMVDNEMAMKMIIAKVGTITPERKKMGIIPENAEPLANNAGVAPGIFIKIAGKTYIILPGVPREVESIMDGTINRIRIKDFHYIDRTFELENTLESLLAPVIAKMMKTYGDRVYIKSHPKLSREGKPWVELEISASGKDEAALNSLIDSVIEDIQKEMIHKDY
ncbi:MAG: molybdopterin-binding protein [Ferroplasma sp.]